MPPHEIYIEAHLGGGAVMRHKYPAKRNIGIEIDSEVIECRELRDGMTLQIYHLITLEM